MKDAVVWELGRVRRKRAPEPGSGQSQIQSLVSDVSAAERAETRWAQSATGFSHGQVTDLRKESFCGTVGVELDHRKLSANGS